MSKILMRFRDFISTIKLNQQHNGHGYNMVFIYLVLHCLIVRVHLFIIVKVRQRSGKDRQGMVKGVRLKSLHPCIA